MLSVLQLLAVCAPCGSCSSSSSSSNDGSGDNSVSYNTKHRTLVGISAALQTDPTVVVALQCSLADHWLFKARVTLCRLKYA
jgi:hypothetical protein